MTSKFKVDRVLDSDDLELIESELEHWPPHEYNHQMMRECWHYLYLDNNPKLHQLSVKLFDHFEVKEARSKDYNVQSHILEYMEGGSADQHLDIARHTIVTMLHKSNEGGLMEIDSHVLDPEVGESIYYQGNEIQHGVTEVTSGTRVVLVSWVMKKDDIPV